jgi:hypothetical protein
MDASACGARSEDEVNYKMGKMWKEAVAVVA